MTAIALSAFFALGCDKVADPPAPTGEPTPTDLMRRRRGFHGRIPLQRGGGGAPTGSAPAADASVAPSGAPSASAPAIAEPRDAARGLYVAVADGDTKAAALDAPFVDGVTLAPAWSALEPSDGKPDWSSLDAALASAVSHKKGVRLDVRSGVAPKWLFDGGAKKVELTVARSAAKGAPTAKVTVAPPWDPVFLEKWKRFVGALGEHVRSIDGAYDALRIVGVGGVGLSGSETRLVGPGAAQLGDAVKRWQAAGYRPSKVLEAWKEIAGAYDAAFPGKALAVTLDDAGGFPLLDESGAAVASGDDGVTRALVDLGLAAYPKRFVLVEADLGAKGETTLLVESEKHGAFVGFRANGWIDAQGASRAGCGDAPDRAHACSDDELEALLEHGIALGARSLEVGAGEVADVKALTSAHAKLAALHP